jgi:hypothetical protein
MRSISDFLAGGIPVKSAALIPGASQVPSVVDRCRGMTSSDSGSLHNALSAETVRQVGSGRFQTVLWHFR